MEIMLGYIFKDEIRVCNSEKFVVRERIFMCIAIKDEFAFITPNSK